MAIEIVAGKSIGELHLGARLASLPKDAIVDKGLGQLDGVSFSLENDAIDDVWIDNLRKFPHELHFRGKAVPKESSLEDLKSLFGPCQEVQDMIGGTFFTCHSGLVLGTDIGGRADVVQIRLKRR